ncbi:MAG: DUF1294 domain-containing protein [Patescibacteria group bacterium]|nr:DUF1294 domain-containing protein [Patescibacteria group bacterium]
MLTSLNLSFLNQLLLFYTVINISAFAIMLVDKIKSKKHGSGRISEGKLFFLATAFGALGVYVGMFVFRHKTRKWYFLIGIPLLIVQNIFLFYYFYLMY